MPESKISLLQYLDEEAKKKNDLRFLAKRIQQLVRDYYSVTKITKITISDLFKECNETLPVKESYFKQVVRKSWITVTEDDIEYVMLDKQKKLRIRIGKDYESN